YIAEHYSSFDELSADGLDALIITGANVANPALAEEPFWKPLAEVAHWAEENVTSTLCSCLATHALLKLKHGIDRQQLPRKRWGVYSHKVTNPEHPLLREVNTRFDAPHSRHNDITRNQLEAAGLAVLAESESGGVHLATSPDQLRLIYFQGHPEYDASSLWKEYKREAFRFAAGERGRPPLPENYLDGGAQRLARQLLDVASDRARVAEIEAAVEPLIDNTWGDTAKAIFNNWLGLVYRFTDLDRRRPFMPGVDPEDPLGLLAGGRNQQHSR
ncbi:MAG: homoserine O-acetyltransferase/O-succinyltransferase family protein, partial [Candidatus Wenzhouxiangella sp. M2_3B_020]